MTPKRNIYPRCPRKAKKPSGYLLEVPYDGREYVAFVDVQGELPVKYVKMTERNLKAWRNMARL